MKVLMKSLPAWSALATAALYGLAALTLPEDGVRNVSYALMACAAAIGFLRWLPDAVKSFHRGRAGSEFLIVGVTSVLAILLVHRIWVISKAYYPALDMDLITYFIVVMLAWACGLIAIAPDVEDGVIAKRSWVLIGVSLFMAGVVSGVSIALSLVG